MDTNTVAFTTFSRTTSLQLLSLSAALLTDRGTIFSHATLKHHAKPSTIQPHI